MHAALGRAPLVSESIHALTFQEQQAMLIEMHLLHGQKLSGLKRHHVHVEVVLGRRREQLAQPEYLPIARNQRLGISAANLHLRPVALRQSSGDAAWRDVALLVHERSGGGGGRQTAAAGASPRQRSRAQAKGHMAGRSHVSRVRGKVRKVVGRKHALDGAGVHINSAVQDEYKAVRCGLRRSATRARLRKGHTHRSTPGKGSADEELAADASVVSSVCAA